MRKIVLMILFVMFMSSTAQAVYQLVWADEFDGSSINSQNWWHQVWGGAGNNNEMQYYTGRPENSFVSGGYLHIVAREEQYEEYNYTSARLTSDGLQDFLYGRLEARIKIPNGKGMWPAFWMMPTDWAYGGWAASGEIDILEAVNKMDYIRGSVHYGGVWPDNRNSFGDYREGRGPNATIFSDAFHTYAIEWEPTEFRWYVDGNLYYTRTNSGWWVDDAAWNEFAPFDKRFNFILNIAVGGDWPGAPDASTIFPQEMLIDWVRVYQHPNTDPSVSITSPSNGANLPAGNVTIEASASDSDGTIDRVWFFAGSTFIGEDSTAPYSISWGAVDGCYTLKATALDDLGGQAEDTIDITVGGGCPQLPFYGSPQAIPGQIEAEDFDLGPNGEAYSDADAGNNGGAYRPDTDVDMEACTDTGGGYNVGWISETDWMDYQVDVASAGTYTVEVRVASNATGGSFHIEFDGVDKTGTITVPITGGWQNWVTVSASADLSAGPQEMTFVNTGSATDEFNLNYYNVTGGGSPCTSSSMHVESIVPGTASGSRGNKRGKATVTINDDCGNPVAGADVTGTFTGDFSETVSGTTNGSGVVDLITTAQVKKPTFGFCVDDVTGSLPYASGDNVETCDNN